LDWDALVAHNGVLHKKWEAPNLKSNVMQIVSQRCIKRVLEEAHDTLSSGHFEINKEISFWRKFENGFTGQLARKM